MHLIFSKAIKYYKTPKAIKEKFGFSYPRISHWKATGKIPSGPAHQMHIDSGGKLKLSKD